MFEHFFEDEWWPGLLLWAAIYSSDFIATILSARLYRVQAKEHFVFEGSFELNPSFHKDVDSLRWVSPRFLIALLGSCLVLAAIWWLSHRDPPWPNGYLFILGAIVLLEAAVHMRHLRNLFLFRSAFGPGGITGRIEYSRKILLRLSSFEFLEYSVLYFVLFLATRSWFLLGGSLACLGVANGHRALTRKHKADVSNREHR